MVVHTYTFSTQEAGAGGSLWFQIFPDIQSKSQDNQGHYTEKHYLDLKPNIK